MTTLRKRLSELIPPLRNEIKDLAKANGDKVLSNVTVAQAYGGMRGVLGMICDTSYVDPDKGLIIRGKPISELTEKLSEEIFYLLLTGELPDKEALKDLQEEYAKRCEIPSYVWNVLKCMPKDSHPMVMLDAAILVLEKESVFRKRYDEGMKKEEYWEAAVEDSLSLLAKLPAIAAGIYRMRFNKGNVIPPNPKLNWGANYAYMLGIKDPSGSFADLIRLYMVLHCDHEGGNVSAFACHTVASALSDIYYAVSAGLNGLAGPLHGLANQECLKYVLGTRDKFGGVPSDEDLKKDVWDLLNSGQVVPGYGHAVLRQTDPRFTAFLNFGNKVCPEDEVFQIVDRLYAVVPDILKQQGKAKDPYPNVDAGSGSLLYHFGITEFDYYTVLFAVSRAQGMCAQYIYNRALGTAITRPKSVTTDWVKSFLAKA